MAWSRYVQTGFEMGRAGELTFSDNLLPPEEFSTSSPITGNASFYVQGKSGIGYQFESPPTQVRMGWLFKSKGSLENVPLIIMYTRETSGVGRIVWYYNKLTHNMTLYYIDQDDDIVDSDTYDIPPVYSFNSSQETIMSCGMVAEIGSGGFASFYANGEKILNFDASALGMEQANSIFAVKMGETNIGLSGMYETHFDDWYIDTGSGEPDEAPPTIRFGIIRPDSASVAPVTWSTNGSTNADAINEIIGDDDEYNYTSLPTNQDKFSFDSFTLPDDSEITSVIPIFRARTGKVFPALSIRTISYDGVTHDYGSEQAILLGYRYFWERYLTAPDGSSWSESDINSNQFGYELRS